MKRQLNRSARAYIHRRKKHIRNIMAERKIKQARLSSATGIPRSSISRWLSPHNDEFMGVADAVVLSEAIGVPVCAVLAEPELEGGVVDAGKMEIIMRLSMMPKSHLEAMLKCYSVIVGDESGAEAPHELS